MDQCNVKQQGKIAYTPVMNQTGKRSLQSLPHLNIFIYTLLRSPRTVQKPMWRTRQGENEPYGTTELVRGGGPGENEGEDTTGHLPTTADEEEAGVVTSITDT